MSMVCWFLIPVLLQPHQVKDLLALVSAADSAHSLLSTCHGIKHALFHYS
jgi:hypothetical protein